MYTEYTIVYKTENNYENWVNDAHWQFLIIPEQNKSQEFISIDFINSLNAQNEFSINGYGFKTIRVCPKQKFKSISFEATIRLIKKEINPFDFVPAGSYEEDYKRIQGLDFKVDFEPFLTKTHFTAIPSKNEVVFKFNEEKSIFENLQALNNWIFTNLTFKTEVTHLGTTLDEILEKRHGVCQDFTHLFCALARLNSIPARYASGYLHQGNGYFGDSQMHAWAEAYIPNVGWVGFDPTNDLLTSSDHIKVAHGKDYRDCAPIKGVVYTTGQNKTSHVVKVSGQQQQ